MKGTTILINLLTALLCLNLVACQQAERIVENPEAAAEAECENLIDAAADELLNRGADCLNRINPFKNTIENERELSDTDLVLELYKTGEIKTSFSSSSDDRELICTATGICLQKYPHLAKRLGSCYEDNC